MIHFLLRKDTYYLLNKKNNREKKDLISHYMGSKTMSPKIRLEKCVNSDKIRLKNYGER